MISLILEILQKHNGSKEETPLSSAQKNSYEDLWNSTPRIKTLMKKW